MKTLPDSLYSAGADRYSWNKLDPGNSRYRPPESLYPVFSPELFLSFHQQLLHYKKKAAPGCGLFQASQLLLQQGNGYPQFRKSLHHTDIRIIRFCQWYSRVKLPGREFGAVWEGLLSACSSPGKRQLILHTDRPQESCRYSNYQTLSLNHPLLSQHRGPGQRLIRSDYESLHPVHTPPHRPCTHCKVRRSGSVPLLEALLLPRESNPPH